MNSINFADLIPSEWKVHNVDGDNIKISYKNVGRGNNPKQFVLPKSIKINTQLAEAVGMYLGDGKLGNDKHHLQFTSKDKDIAKFMLEFFINRLNMKFEDVRFELSYKKLLKDSVSRWANDLNIPKNNIHLKQSDRHREECMGMQIGGIIITTIFRKIIQETLRHIRLPDLRRGFLRGLFAAEGGIGIVKKENYIAYMAYHLSYAKELHLANFTQNLLKLEGITSKQIVRKKKGERYIQMTNWKNYYKCWQIGLFDLCRRKKQKFLEKLSKTKFLFKIKKEFISHLLNSSNLPHRQIALKLGICPGTLCILNKERTDYINSKDLLNLAKFNGLHLSQVRNAVIGLRVNNSTRIDNKEFIDFILQKTWHP